MNIAIITARGGSKGLPRKNVLPLAGKPLIAWTIEAAKTSPNVDDVFVTTDDEEIASVSREYGANVIPRPTELAQDTTSSEPVIKHAIQWLSSKDITPKLTILLQPTSPLRSNKHIKESIDFCCEKNASAVISVFEPTHSPVKAYVEKENGSIEGLYDKDAPYSRRQDLPRAFQPNGAIYVFDTKQFMATGQIPREDVYPYVMSEDESSDIDTQEDLIKAERIIKERYE
ncbi:acylneuraminate cytidylyltransferase family protein [Enterovibrio sp. ZSDZ42]|uniref:Acylneuraminate cytidylyltransferase family protein n=1 Tax=Enterovibrio gelatinilyticus TaxID=2899819 RepID=A0ABT5R6Z7_9GAMM|nr:acylneuraminate cytidylyltransferase family protein [Enterovibrio sp. ZSDZ42]MDD1796041.1 acylneuraminate cytidylyltransferase family protein [Enterovibrio sp. ZSDZ42]